jgi:uncharacterized protein (TIGR00255 family)
MQSMTGFGSGRSEAGGCRVEIELRTVNHRFLDIVIRSPRMTPGLEDAIKKQAAAALSRGRVEISLSCQWVAEEKPAMILDKELALAYDKSLRELAQSLGADYSPDVLRLAVLPEVLRAETGAERETPPALTAEALARALNSLVAARAAEGAHIERDLRARLTLIRDYVLNIRKMAPGVAAAWRARLRERMSELTGGDGADEQRLAAEAALFADKADITEETVRLLGHADQFEQALAAAEPAGRRLGFLLQEMGREVNTIGAKANDARIAALVVDSKCELEKMREQIQNLE